MHARHTGLVLPPLFITMVFCFALVFMQQRQAASRAVSTKQAYQKAHAKLSPPPLKTIETLQPITVSPSPTAGTTTGSSPSSGIKTSAPPQPSKNSGSETQSAGQYSLPVQINIPSTLDKARNTLGL